MRVLVTGANGRIGSSFVRAHADDAKLRLIASDLASDSDLPVPYRQLDVTDRAACLAACEGMDTVVHLAAVPDADSDFMTAVLPLNMLGTVNMADAAVEAACRRFVFASSAQAVEGYPESYQIREFDPPVPANAYGVGKAFGEALCASLASRSETSFVAIRIANYGPVAPGFGASLRDRAAWLSPRDANQLFRLAVCADVDGMVLAHGASNNSVMRLSIEKTRETLGYAPVDDAFADDLGLAR